MPDEPHTTEPDPEAYDATPAVVRAEDLAVIMAMTATHCDVAAVALGLVGSAFPDGPAMDGAHLAESIGDALTQASLPWDKVTDADPRGSYFRALAMAPDAVIHAVADNMREQQDLDDEEATS